MSCISWVQVNQEIKWLANFKLSIGFCLKYGKYHEISLSANISLFLKPTEKLVTTKINLSTIYEKRNEEKFPPYSLHKTSNGR